MADQEKIYAKGLRSFPKHDNAPEFVLGTVVINIPQLSVFLKEQMDSGEYITEYKEQKQLKLKMSKSKKDGSVIFEVDTYKAQPKDQPKKDDPTGIDDLPF